MTGFLARQEQFAVVGSTNDVVRDWLAAGTPEVCLAVADEQTSGRGREGRTWIAPAGGALLLSLGFRPTWLAPDRVWRLAASASLAMAEAAEHVAGLPERTMINAFSLIPHGAPIEPPKEKLCRISNAVLPYSPLKS